MMTPPTTPAQKLSSVPPTRPKLYTSSPFTSTPPSTRISSTSVTPNSRSSWSPYSPDSPNTTHDDFNDQDPFNLTPLPQAERVFTLDIARPGVVASPVKEVKLWSQSFLSPITEEVKTLAPTTTTFTSSLKVQGVQANEKKGKGARISSQKECVTSAKVCGWLDKTTISSSVLSSTIEKAKTAIVKKTTFADLLKAQKSKANGNNDNSVSTDGVSSMSRSASDQEGKTHPPSKSSFAALIKAQEAKLNKNNNGAHVSSSFADPTFNLQPFPRNSHFQNHYIGQGKADVLGGTQIVHFSHNPPQSRRRLSKPCRNRRILDVDCDCTPHHSELELVRAKEKTRLRSD